MSSLADLDLSERSFGILTDAIICGSRFGADAHLEFWRMLLLAILDLSGCSFGILADALVRGFRFGRMLI